MTTEQAVQVHGHDCSPLDSRYVRRLQPDPSGGYTATIHEFPGCIAEGDTAEEALANLESTAQSWILSAEANGYPVAPPVDFDGASGKVALRISRRLHQLAAERADMEGVSLNQFIGNALASYLGQKDSMERLVKELDATLQRTLQVVYASMHSVQVLRSTGHYIPKVFEKYTPDMNKTVFATGSFALSGQPFVSLK